VVALLGAYTKFVPLHIAGGVKELVNNGVGLTTTFIVCVFVQDPIDIV
jgi:hypothetical protein